MNITRKELKEMMINRFDRIQEKHYIDNAIEIDPSFYTTKIYTKTLQKIWEIVADDYFSFILRDLTSRNYWLSLYQN